MFIDVLENFRERALNTEEEYTLLYKNIYNSFIEIVIPVLPYPIQSKAEELYLNNFHEVDI